MYRDVYFAIIRFAVILFYSILNLVVVILFIYFQKYVDPFCRHIRDNYFAVLLLLRFYSIPYSKFVVIFICNQKYLDPFCRHMEMFLLL